LAVTYPQLHVIHIDEEKQNMQGKKFALTLGIKAAKHDIVLLTDADCTPRSKEWISSIVAYYHKGVEVVIGLSPMEKSRGWLNKLIRFDNMAVALQYLGAAKRGRPYMGVGRNLSYTPEAFFRVGGFKSHYSIMSGDDDLLVNEIANKNNTVVVFEKNSQTISKAKKTWKEWVNQKKRHFITAPLYKSRDKFWLTIYPGTWFLLHGSIITLLVFFPQAFPILLLLLVRSICLIWIQFRFLKITDQPKDLAWWSPVLEVQLNFTQLLLYCSNLISKPQKWN
jgi:cellulose synthase/poly-beta-1,6-N-acetylglucosamine synthase-like glycosyltransferase